MSELVVKIADISEIETINDFLTDHFREPIYCSHVNKEESLEKLPSDGLRDGIESGTTLMAFSGEKLVGVLIGEKFKSHSGDFEFPEGEESKGRDIMDMLSFIEKKADICNRFKLINCLSVFIISVHKDHLRQGIAAKLFKFCMENAQAKGFEAVSVDCTSSFTARLAENCGMTLVSSVTYDDYNAFAGKVCFVPCEPHTEIKSYLKFIDKN